jgi:ketosteroid isomerase-like protein
MCLVTPQALGAACFLFCIFSKKTLCMKKLSLLLIVAFVLSAHTFLQAQNTDVKIILSILDKQTAAWNRGDITAFMDGYWESDSLMFIGKSGITYGWQPTLENYRRGYPDTAAMGKLAFKILHVKNLAKDGYFIVGKWQLTRSIGDIGGHYTLLFKKIKGRWVIVADHSS